MSETLVCWRCGASLDGVRRPVMRLAECPMCHAELHVCRLCVHYNPRVGDRCDEPRAEHPREPERANFCDYFQPRPGAYQAPAGAKAEAARSELDKLFGKESAAVRTSDAIHGQIERLFGGGDGNDDKDA